MGCRKEKTEMTYTPLEAEILSILKDGFEQEEGTSPENLFAECVAAIDVRKTLPNEAIKGLVNTLLLLIAEGLVKRIEGNNEFGVYCVVGYKLTQDGLRAARSSSSESGMNAIPLGS